MLPDITIDPVTGTWAFQLDGHQIEVEPRYGYVKIDSQPHHTSIVEGLTNPDELAGKPLQAIERLITLERAKQDSTLPIPHPTTRRRDQATKSARPAPTKRECSEPAPKGPQPKTKRASTPSSKAQQTKGFDTVAAAEYLGLSPKTLETKRVRGGGPPYAKLGRRVVYRQEDLDTWLEEHHRTSTSDQGNPRQSPSS